MLPFIVGCLEALRSEEAAVSRTPDAASATGTIAGHPEEAGARGSAPAAASSDSNCAGAVHVRETAAQQESQSCEEATGVGIAPHKQAPFAGAKAFDPCRLRSSLPRWRLEQACCVMNLPTAGRGNSTLLEELCTNAANRRKLILLEQTATMPACGSDTVQVSDCAVRPPHLPCNIPLPCAGPLMHLLLDLVPRNHPADGLEGTPAGLRDRAAVLYRSYAAERTTFARSALKVAQVVLQPGSPPVNSSDLYYRL